MRERSISAIDPRATLSFAPSFFIAAILLLCVLRHLTAAPDDTDELYKSRGSNHYTGKTRRYIIYTFQRIARELYFLLSRGLFGLFSARTLDGLPIYIYRIRKLYCYSSEYFYKYQEITLFFPLCTENIHLPSGEKCKTRRKSAQEEGCWI